MAYEGDMDDPNVGADGGYTGGAEATSEGTHDAAASASADIAYGGPTGDLSGTLGDIEADIAADINAAQVAAAGMEFGGNVAAPMGGGGTTPSATAPASGLQTQASDPLADMMAVVDAAVANTGMPAVGQGGLPGMGVTGYGTEMGVNTPSALGPVGLDAGFQSQATPGATGSVTGGMLGPAPGGPAQNQAAGQMAGGMVGGQPGPSASDIAAYGQDQGGSTAGVGLSGQQAVGGPPGSGGSYGGWGSDITAQRDQAAYGADQSGAGVGLSGTAPGEPGVPGLGGWGADLFGGQPSTIGPNITAYDATVATPGTVGTLDSLAEEADSKGTVADALAAMRDSDDLVDDEDEDYSGLPKGMTSEDTVQIVDVLKDAAKGKGPGWAAYEFARKALGLPKSTEEDRMRDALGNLEAQGQQEEMEMNVSTGEDARAIQQFRAKYPWAKRMSEFEIQAYINSPALLKLKLENQQLQESVQAGNDLTSSQVNALWAPQSFSGLPGGPMQGMPGGPMQGMPIYQQQT